MKTTLQERLKSRLGKYPQILKETNGNIALAAELQMKRAVEGNENTKKAANAA